MTSAGAESTTRQGGERVRMVARLSSVPPVRRFVEEALAASRWAGLVQDVTLSATELAANATLHSGGDCFDVEVIGDADAVRLAVTDRGTESARAIAALGHAAAAGHAVDIDSPSGRGLFIVAALASAWGVEELSGGTRVWAEFRAERVDGTPRSPQVTGTAAAVQATDVQVIELRGCPPDLLLAHDADLADIVQGLRRVDATLRTPVMAEVAERILGIVRVSAISWDAARLIAKQGVLDGRAVVDVAIASEDAADLPRKVAVLRETVDLAETWIAHGLLEAPVASPGVQRWRDWVEGEMVDQATTHRAPLSFSDWLATHLGD